MKKLVNVMMALSLASMLSGSIAFAVTPADIAAKKAKASKVEDQESESAHESAGEVRTGEATSCALPRHSVASKANSNKAGAAVNAGAKNPQKDSAIDAR